MTPELMQMMLMCMTMLIALQMQRQMLLLVVSLSFIFLFIFSQQAVQYSRKRKRGVDTAMIFNFSHQLNVIATFAATAHLFTDSFRRWWTKRRSRDWFDQMLDSGMDEEFLTQFRMPR